jgi:copper chaperone NosL
MGLRLALGIAAALLFTLAACGGEDTAEAPPPAPLSPEATGYFCNMTVSEHSGPKGQIHLKSHAEAIWFTSVRDTIAFTLLPEEPKDIAAIYVTDMGATKDWDHPEQGGWIEARSAFFVVGSTERGGMGAPELVPFKDRQAAETFAAVHGGTVVTFKEIPVDAVLGAVEISNGTPQGRLDSDIEALPTAQN